MSAFGPFQSFLIPAQVNQALQRTVEGPAHLQVRAHLFEEGERSLIKFQRRQVLPGLPLGQVGTADFDRRGTLRLCFAKRLPPAAQLPAHILRGHGFPVSIYRPPGGGCRLIVGT